MRVINELRDPTNESVVATSLSNVLAGDLGFFYPQQGPNLDLQGNPERGSIKQESDSQVIVRTLVEDPKSSFFARGKGAIPYTLSIVGQVENGGILILDVVGRGASTRIGGSRASINRYTGRTLLKGLNFANTSSSRLHGVSLHFIGLSEWLGREMTTVDPEFDDEGKHRGITVKARSAEPFTMPLVDGMSLELRTHWELGGYSDLRTLYAPLSVGCHSDTPAEALDLLTPIIHLQDLFNIAHQGFMKASGGRAETDALETPGKAPELWNYQLMELPRGAAEPTSRSELPLFTLATIGGAQALPAWVQLCREHPRLTSTVTDKFRIGPPTADTHMRDVGAAIEYWRSANARTSWARSTDLYPLALANSIGSKFEEWLGVPVDGWADRLWESYLASKHFIPTSNAKDSERATLALSGWVLLVAAALTSISEVDWTAEHLLSSHRLRGIAARVRELFD